MRSKDGKWYDNPADAWAADEAWETQRKEQERQNILLEQHNQLLEQNQKDAALLAKRNNDHKEKLQQNQIKHEENMRILKLFDDIGLNSRIYNDFMEYLFGDNISNLINEIQNKKNEEKKLKKDIEFHTKTLENPEELERIYFDNDYTKELLKFKEQLKHFISGTSTKEEKRNIYNYFYTDDMRQIDLKYSNEIKKANIFLVAGISFFILALVFLCFIIIIGVVICVIIGTLCLVKYNKCINSEFINLAEKELKIIDKVVNVEDKKEYTLNELKKAKKALSEIESYKNKLKETLPKWKKFIEFRKKHYNSKLENILIETGVKDLILELDFEYPKINNNNKIEDGNIEDYIAYFEDI